MKTIVLISSGQPSTNPRLIKEANILVNRGYKVLVIYSFWTFWAWNADKVLFKNIEWSPLLAGGSPFKNVFQYNYSRVRNKIAKFLIQNFYWLEGLAEFSINRAYSEVLREVMEIKADLYIAHNLAALPIAVKAARFYKAKCGFDAEDFHRQEVNDDFSSNEFKIAKYLEDKYLPEVNYITAASPLIAVEYKKLYPFLNPIVINNVFNSYFQIPPNFQNRQGLSLFWFSQTIGKGRGLEDVLKALGILKNEFISFTLLGNVTKTTKEYLIDLAFENGLLNSQLIFLDPVVPDDIFSLASQFDIGLALEQNTPLNRDICLTNKIFTYVSVGNAIIATETKAQKQFMDTYQSIGKTYPIGDYEKLSQNILYYYENRDELKKAKKASFALANYELNWEKESEKFLKVINDEL